MARHTQSNKRLESLPRIKPMLAQTGEPFDSPDYLFEVKWDGTRCLAYVENNGLSLINRRDIEMRERYPELECLKDLPANTLLDGEIVVLEDGLPSFNKLQQREQLQSPRRIEMAARRLPATLIAFDVCYHDGRKVMSEPLSARKELLAAVVQSLGNPHVVVMDYIIEQGTAFFRQIEEHGLEGIMAKRLTSRYEPGKRSPEWLKIKVAQVETFSIIGYTPAETSGDIGAVIIGERTGNRWTYKGKVGTGFTQEQRRQLLNTLSTLPELDNPPADGPSDAVWRDTGLHCRVRYFEKTFNGMLRAPSFKGLVASSDHE